MTKNQPPGTFLVQLTKKRKTARKLLQVILLQLAKKKKMTTKQLLVIKPPLPPEILPLTKKLEEKIILKERQLILDHLHALQRNINRHIYSTYGSVFDLSLSAYPNAHHILASMLIKLYFSRPFNCAFHNFCSNTNLPVPCHSLPGLGLNFCLHPPTTAGKTTIDLPHFCHDANTRIFFTHSQIPIPKLFI